MFQFVIPLHHLNWSTRSILEGITYKYNPLQIYLITSNDEIKKIKENLIIWKIPNIKLIDEDNFFFEKYGLSKANIINKIKNNKPNYAPGWLYQQIIKLGSPDVINDLKNIFVVWDSDLLPVNSWPLVDNGKEKFALLQDNTSGNPEIINLWEKFIKQVLEIEPVIDQFSTFTSHHMIFKKIYLSSLKKQIQKYFNSEENWIELIIKAANIYGSMGEYWMYSSWVNHVNKSDLNFYPYSKYGSTTERFYDDGNGIFSKKLKDFLKHDKNSPFFPSYISIIKFLESNYTSLPSSLSFETNPRHIKKKDNVIHVEEKRSKWRMQN
tara:strand:- start:598 stop:1566 length:969 start_codon:yes stop_codon:yes gene_type:complete